MRSPTSPLIIAAFLVACAPARSAADDDPCGGVRSLRGTRAGYDVEWTCHDDRASYDRVCEEAGYGPTFEHAIVKGTGRGPVGRRLKSELEPELGSLSSSTSWGIGYCGGRPWYKLVVGRLEDMDRAIEIVGAYLRRRDANDRVIIDLGLLAAPAL